MRKRLFPVQSSAVEITVFYSRYVYFCKSEWLWKLLLNTTSGSMTRQLLRG